jgi:hypothetical protein
VRRHKNTGGRSVGLPLFHTALKKTGMNQRFLMLYFLQNQTRRSRRQQAVT